MTAEDWGRLWSRVDTSAGAEACWPWQAAKTPKGYPRFGDTDYVHRLVLELHSGTTGPVACHSCDNPSCCNPCHLFWGSHRDNSQDMVAKSRSTRGEKHGNARLTADQVAAIRKAQSDGERRRSVAARFGISIGTVGNIWRGETWRAPGEPTWRSTPDAKRKKYK